MCIAIVKPSGVSLPSEEILERCFIINPDGAGFSTVADNGKGFMIRKGYFNFESYYKALVNNISKESLAFIHMRIATCGYTDDKGQLWAVAGQCHPFPVTKDYRLMQRTMIKCVDEVFMHNGTIDIDTEEHKGKETSDTMTFNRMACKGNLDAFDKGDRLFMEVASDPCRLAYMRFVGGVPSYKLIGEWEEQDDLWYSNDGYKRRLMPQCKKFNPNATYIKYHNRTYSYGQSEANDGYLTPEQVYSVWYGECPFSNKQLIKHRCSTSEKNYEPIVEWLGKATFKELLLEGFDREMAWDICNARNEGLTMSTE